MFEVVSHKWEKGRVTVNRRRPLFATEEEANRALQKIRKAKSLRYYVREVLENGS